ncbi:hypothetical protein D9M70_400160 [compost metagenome]
MLAILLPLRATMASAALMSSRIQNSSTSSPCDSAEAIGDVPASPMAIWPDAMARITSPPPPNWRNDTL